LALGVDLLTAAALGRARPQAGSREPRARATATIRREPAEVMADVPDQRLAWRSLPGSRLRTAVTVRLAPAPRIAARPLLRHVQDGRIDPGFIVTQRLPLDAAPEAYELFEHERDGCSKVVLTP
jgi:hypothetical protein